MKKQVIILSYYFPPLGGPGVQRNLKYSKFLPEFGYDPIVISVKDILYYMYDASLMKEFPETGVLVRADSVDILRVSFQVKNILNSLKHIFQKSEAVTKQRGFSEGSRFTQVFRWIRDIFVLPDTAIGWVPFAVFEALKLIRSTQVPVVLASMGPVSSGIAAFIIYKMVGTPYVLDFRDGWLDDPHISKPTRLHFLVHGWLERTVVENAKHIVVFGEPLLSQLTARYSLNSSQISILYNGFDLDDLNGLPTVELNNKKRIVYMGGLYKVLYEKNFQALIAAFQTLPDNIRSDIEIHFVGIYYEEAKELVRSLDLVDSIIFHGYRPHSEALSFLKSADAGIIMLQEGDFTAITGKVFEYLMVGCPILACVEEKGPLGKLLNETGRNEWICRPFNAENIAEKLLKLHRSGYQRPESSNIDNYDRKKNTLKLSRLLDLAIE
jgi:glycosyltransferase involved in cell wall biosynthesis